jgi:hypothetical protein
MWAAAVVLPLNGVCTTFQLLSSSGLLSDLATATAVAPLAAALVAGSCVLAGLVTTAAAHAWRERRLKTWLQAV